MPAQGWVHQTYECDENGNDVSHPILSYSTEWNRKFRRALKEDRLSEYEKSIRHYALLKRDLENFMKHDADNSLTREIRSTLCKLCECLERRKTSLENPETPETIRYDELTKLKPVFANLLSWNQPFPIFIDERSASKISLESRDSGLCESFTDDINDFDIVKSNEGQSSEQTQMFPPLKRIANFTRCSVHVTKLNLKYMDVRNPYLMVSFRDADSVNLTPIQNILPSEIIDRDVHFKENLHLQRYLEKVPKGSNIFFELMHTSKSGRTQTKCYAILPTKNLVNGTLKLGLYKPPTSYHLKKLSRFSKKKELYLHVEVQVGV